MFPSILMLLSLSIFGSMLMPNSSDDMDDTPGDHEDPDQHSPDHGGDSSGGDTGDTSGGDSSGDTGGDTDPQSPDKIAELLAPWEDLLAIDPADLSLNEGTEGDDYLTTDRHRAALLDGKGGDDRLSGSDESDVLLGGAGDDRLYDFNRGAVDASGAPIGGRPTGDDLLVGGAGDDYLHATSGTDTLLGGEGNDTFSDGLIEPENFQDLTLLDDDPAMMDGGAGDDLLMGSLGDTMTGGTGAESFDVNIYGGGDGPAIITDFNPDEDQVIFRNIGDETDDHPPVFDIQQTVTENGDLILGDMDSPYAIIRGLGRELSAEEFPMGQPGADDLGPGDDLWNGTQNRDLVQGNGGDDTLLAGDGYDTLFGGDGSDSLDGGSGNDWIHAGRFVPTLDETDSADTLLGGADSDSLYTGADSVGDLADGGADSDYILASGEDAADTLLGGVGGDFIESFNGSEGDFIDGGAGDDLIKVNGAATIEGGDGADHIMSGSHWSDPGLQQIDAGADGDLIDLAHAAQVTTGTGTDTLRVHDLFEFAPGDAAVVVTDFTPGQDMLQLFGESVRKDQFDPANVIQTVSEDGSSLSVGDPDAPWVVLQGVSAPLSWDVVTQSFS
ncbi:calcium-binding protein [Thioclava sp. BHET1]|nr:calcium-binding protein [Thioclava sp. BHET1]